MSTWRLREILEETRRNRPAVTWLDSDEKICTALKTFEHNHRTYHGPLPGRPADYITLRNAEAKKLVLEHKV
jgi:hypothetical protein